MFIENIYHPVPIEMIGNFYEITEGDKSRFFELNYIEYSHDKFSRLVQMGCLEDSPLKAYMNLIDTNNLNTDTCFIYKLQTYIGDPTIKDPWLFNKGMTMYKQYGFTSFQEVENFCKNRWDIDIINFVPLKETNIAS